MNTDLVSCRVTKEGDVLDFNGFVTAENPGHEERGSIASNGRDYFITYQQRQPGVLGPFRGPVHGVRVAALGAPLDRPPFEIATNIYVGGTPHVEFCGSDTFLVLYDVDYYSVNGSLVMISEAPPHLLTVELKNEGESASLVWTSTTFRNYRVQYRRSLDANNPWEDAGGEIPGDLPTTSSTIPLDPRRPRGFFRVLQVDP